MKSRISKTLIPIAVFISIILISGIVFAKYITEKKKNVLYTAGSFYFTSDLLSDGAALNTYEYGKGIDEISVDLKNNIDDLRFSEVDIYYNVKITDIAGNPVTNKNENIIPEITNNKLLKNQIDKNIVKFSNLKTGSYIVTATSTNPYEKEIKANFIITNKNENITFSVNDTINSPIAQLTITTNDFSGTTRIIWPEGTAPDSTNSLFSDVNIGYAGGNKQITLLPNSEITIQFFKEDLSRKYSISDFQVEGGN